MTCGQVLRATRTRLRRRFPRRKGQAATYVAALRSSRADAFGVNIYNKLCLMIAHDLRASRACDANSVSEKTNRSTARSNVLNVSAKKTTFWAICARRNITKNYGHCSHHLCSENSDFFNYTTFYAICQAFLHTVENVYSLFDYHVDVEQHFGRYAQEGILRKAFGQA